MYQLESHTLGPKMINKETVQWGTTFRFINNKPFTSLGGVVIDPDVVIITFVPTEGNPVFFTYTNGTSPPDPDFRVNRLAFDIASVTPSYPTVGSVGYITSEANELKVGDTITISGVSASGYSGKFKVAGVQSDTGFSIVNATVTTPTLASAKVAVNGVYYEDVDTTDYNPGVWSYWIEGAPVTSGLDTTKTKVRSKKKSLLVE